MITVLTKSSLLFRASSASLCQVNIKQTMTLLPRDAGKFIAENSDDVKIISSGIEDVSKKIVSLIKSDAGKQGFGKESWLQHDLTPKTLDRAAVDWVFLTDLLNFSFWSADDSQSFKVNYKGKVWTGYWSLCAAVNRALDEGIPITDPKYFGNITTDQVQHVFRSDSPNPMPLMEERIKSMHQAGQVLVEKYESSFTNVIGKAGQSAQKLIQIVVEDFPSFNDVTAFKGKKVAIYKRVQILVADLWSCCDGKSFGTFNDINTLTMFADYRVPQALSWFKCLEYTDSLMDVLKKNTMMKSGDRLEVEIRGCSIWAVELIVDEVKRLVREDKDIPADTADQVNAITVDYFLWDYRRAHAGDTSHIPFHKIRCIYY